MRLIDVDALLSKNCTALKGPNNGENDSCSECLGRPHGYCCMEMKGDEIYNAPTIDAIPVEWMRNLCAIAKMTTDDEMFVDWLIQTWQEEQEANQ